MCMYCYLVCNYNKCAYLRLFVNREQMLDKIIKTCNESEKELVIEIGSNSDLVLENTITGNLQWTIKKFIEKTEIINKIELGTSPLKNRVEAINKLKEADYKVGILIAPIVLVENWKEQYEELIRYLADNLSEKVKNDVFFELIFMTYSYIHNAINTEAFPNNPVLYDKDKMTGRGRGKYTYKKEVRQEAEEYIRMLMKKYFPNNEIKYIV